jgi:zinc protease
MTIRRLPAIRNAIPFGEPIRHARSGRHARRSLAAFAVLASLLLAVPGTLPAATAGQDVLRATLDNGLRVVIVRNRLAPVATTVVNYLVGSNEAPEGFPGMAHAQEHMMFRGSPGLSARQLANMTAALGGMFDADTQQTVTQYFFETPAEDVDVALHIEAIRMRGVLDSERLWKEERGAIEQEVAQDLSDPQYVFYTRLLATLFKGTAYAHTPLGTTASFDNTTGEMLQRFHETWYVPNNAILLIVGDVDPSDVLAKVEKLFGPIPSKPLPQRPQVQLQPLTGGTMKLETDLPYGLVMMAFRMPGYHSADYPASQVLSDVLANQRGELYRLVTQGKALEVDFQLDTLPDAGLGYVVAAFPKGADPSALEAQIRQRLQANLKQGLSPDLVKAAKLGEETSAELRKNSVFGQAMAWSHALAVQGRQSPEQAVQAIREVSTSDADRVARKYLKLDDAVVGILTPQSSGRPVSSAQGHGPTGPGGGGETFALKQTGGVTLPQWAQKPLERLSVPASTLQPVVSILPNGLKLIVQPAQVSDTVSVYGHIKNEPFLEVPRGKEGVDQVLDQLFSYGTTSLDRIAFQKALDDIGANESAGTDFSLQVLGQHFQRGVALLADNELHPALPPDAFRTVQQQVAGAVGGQLESPGYLAHRALTKGLMPPGDPTLRQATPQTVRALGPQDAKDYYHKVFRPDLTTIVVIGKVTPDEARRVIEKYFGEWRAQGPKPAVLLPSVPPNKPLVTAVPDSSRVQDKVILAQTLGLTRSTPDYYALELGNHVLGGGFYATRLYQDLREKTGLVYYVSSDFDVNKTRARYAVRYACNPRNVSKARALVERNLTRMRTSPVSDDELRQAKAMLLREIPLSESSVDRIADGLLSRTELGLPLDEPTRAAHRYVKLDAQQVQAAFAKWLRPDDLVQVTQGPAPN